ncbi:MAG: hypothetical protein AABZ31_12630 [Bdellovibrionota bacterium]
MKKLEDWIDYLEGEGSLRERTEMNLLLKHSISDQMVLDNLRRLRQAVYETDSTRGADLLLGDKQYMEKMQSQIMKEVRKTKQTHAPNLTVIAGEETLSTSEQDPARVRGLYRT